jgi:hypothetical protein
VIKVVVLGCGPAGLLAAHAASLQGADVEIYSVKQPSIISGAQYFHREIPGLTGAPDGFVTYMKTGTRDGYAKKVYGYESHPVSWDLWEDASVPAWSMHRIYMALWDMYYDGIIDYEIKSATDIYMLERLGADVYISSIPAPKFCEGNHHFIHVPMWITDGIEKDIQVPDNTIIYNGHPGVPWYRASNLFGHESMEFPIKPFRKPGDGAIRGMKPTAHNCDCHPNWMRVGRFGQWKRGVLVHNAFEEVTHAMQQVQRTNSPHRSH